jgi:predicted transcriptional regulator
MPLTEIEQKVLVIAKELIRKHYTLDLKDLYSQSVRLLRDLKPFAIQQAIDGLCHKKVFFGGGALTRDTVLDNETRRDIFDHIRRLPGIHFSAIKRAVNTDSRTMMIHLRVLERFEMIRTENFGNSKSYYDFFLSKEHDVFYHFLHKDKVREIYATILSQPGVSMGALVEHFREAIPPPTLYRKVNTLLENNLLIGTFDAGQLVSLVIPPLLMPIVSSMVSVH